MYIKFYFFIIILEYNKIEKTKWESLCDSVINLVFSLGRDHCSDVCISGRKNLSGTSICIYLSAEHLCSSFWKSLSIFRCDFIFKYSTLWFKYALMAGLFISLLSLCQSDESLVRHFLFFFYLFSGWRNSNFSDDNCLFSVRGCFCSSSLDCL